MKKFERSTSSWQSAWDNNVAKAKAFIDKYGHCQFKDVNTDDAIKLLNWMSNLKAKLRDKKLTKERIEELGDIGIDLGSYSSWDSRWDTNIAKAQKFFSKYGHYNFASVVKSPDYALIRWAYRVNTQLEKNLLPKNKVAQLKEMGISFAIRSQDGNWDSLFKELAGYLKKNPDDAMVLKANKQLKGWVKRQRELFNKNRLPEHRVHLLKSIPLNLDLVNTSWYFRFDQLKLSLENGLNLSPELQSWLHSQKKQHYRNSLSKNKADLLKSLGVQFDYQPNSDHSHSSKILKRRAALFNKELKQLQQFYNTNGHFEITKENSASWPGLFFGVSTTRRMYAEGLLLKSEIEALNKLGFDLHKKTTFDKQWDSTIQKVKEFYSKHGHYDFKASDDKDAKTLASWFHNLRKRAKKNEVSQERIMQLEAMGVDLSLETHQEKWDRKAHELAEYISMNPDDYKVKNANKTLKSWLYKQLQSYRKGSLSEKRTNGLIASGIDLGNTHS